jgi:hypothetical protein
MKDIENGVRRPHPGCINRRVWDISDEVFEEGVKKLRAVVLSRCSDEGINLKTASTEHCMWRKYRGLTKPKKEIQDDN